MDADTHTHRFAGIAVTHAHPRGGEPHGILESPGGAEMSRDGSVAAAEISIWPQLIQRM